MSQKTNEKPPAVVIRRLIHAKRDKVFAAWTNPEMMKQWFYCGEGGAEVKNELRVGGLYENKMFKGCGSSTGQECYTHTGEYLEIIPPEKIVFTWSSHIVTNSRVTVELREQGNATDLVLTHELLDTPLLREQHTEGWEGCLGNLVSYVE